MQNWPSNFHYCSFQSSNFLFLSIQGSVTDQLLLPLDRLCGKWQNGKLKIGGGVENFLVIFDHADHAFINEDPTDRF